MMRWFSVTRLLFFLVFIVPMALIAVYVLSVASDRYESTSSLYITEEAAQSSPLDLTLLGITNAGSTRDILVLKSFIESPRMLELLNRDLNLRSHFTQTTADLVSRMASDASRERFHAYYLNRVVVGFDDEARLLKIKVQSFDRQYSQRILAGILKHSQQFIDTLNANISRAQLKFFEKQVLESENALTVEKGRLRELQKKHKILSTKIATETIVLTISNLENQLAAKKSELNSRRNVLSETAPTIRRLKSEISALESQLKIEKDRLAGTSDTSVSEIASQFQDVRLLIEYKTLRYKANLDAFEKAKVEAARRLRFLTIVSPPTLADEALYPNKPYILVTAAIICLLLYFIFSIIVATIREHA